MPGDDSRSGEEPGSPPSGGTDHCPLSILRCMEWLLTQPKFYFPLGQTPAWGKFTINLQSIVTKPRHTMLSRPSGFMGRRHTANGAALGEPSHEVQSCAQHDHR